MLVVVSDSSSGLCSGLPKEREVVQRDDRSVAEPPAAGISVFASEVGDACVVTRRARDDPGRTVIVMASGDHNLVSAVLIDRHVCASDLQRCFG
jgi:hypothetical protein